MSKTLTLVNTDRNVSINFEAGIEPRDLLKKIAESGNAGSIGLINLRSLLEDGSKEHNGYLIIDPEASADADQDAAVTEALEEAAVEKTEQAEESEAESVEETSEVETQEVADEVPAAEEAEDYVSEEPVPETQEPVEEPAPAKEVTVFGMKVSDLTPKEDKVSVKRPRRNMTEVFKKARGGKHAKFLSLAEAAGFGLNNVQKEERWFCLNLPGYDAADRNAPRIDVSPLKSGSYTLSLYVNDRSQGVKAKIDPVENKAVTPERVVEAMHDVKFIKSPLLAQYVPKAPKAE
jgi:hypothetical protein